MEKSYSYLEGEPNPEALDKESILGKLTDIIETGELEIAVDMSDRAELEQLLGDDDEDFLSNLLSLAAQNGIDIEEFAVRLGIPVERIVDPSA